jgi:hypothetical protein
MIIELEDGYELLSEYVNARTKLKMKCPNGHLFSVNPYNWKRGTRCKECFNERQRQNTQRIKLKNNWLYSRFIKTI